MKVLKIYLEDSCCKTLRNRFLSAYFLIVQTPEEADVIIFQFDHFSYLSQSQIYNKFREKCLVISQTYRPSFLLPGIYINNYQTFLSRKRTKTYSYCYIDVKQKNNYVTLYKDKNFEKNIYTPL